uniref:Replication origin-binding protein n=1 Tax=Lygus hesperus TaxID=30085 RepID=A0A0A9WWX7_LYGHE
MPDQVDIFCVRIKIKDMKKKALLYALGWRSWTKRMVSEAIVTESKNMYLVLLDLFEELSMKVASFRSMKHLLKTAYLFGNLELSVDILLNSITAKNLMIQLWMPTHMYEESAIIGLIKANIKQLKYLVLYRRELVMPYLYKITPRYECVQCSPTGTIKDITKAQNEFPKFYSAALKEANFGQSLKALLTSLIDEVEALTFDSCPWAVVDLTLEHMRFGLKVIEWLKRLHPKLTFNRLMTTKKILEYLNMQKQVPDEKADGNSLEAMLKALK